MTSYLRHLIAGLKQGGVRQVVISPGSRSTPLALLVKRESDLQYFVAVDERSAGFLALGLAKVVNNRSYYSVLRGPLRQTFIQRFVRLKRAMCL